MIGKKLGQRYTIESEISEGGMGAVYKAQHLFLDTPVALKILPPYSDENTKKRFLNEAHKAMACKHDNVVGMYDYVEEKSGVHFLVMEYVPGQDLKSFIESHQGNVPLHQITRIFTQLCEGLDEIHKHHIIHRDIKPENIQIQTTEDGSLRAVILDFGIAKAPLDPKLTTAGTLVGTYAYMSPEQIEDKPLDHRSDIYSLGVILYYLMTGSPPFEESSTQGYINAHLTKVPTPIRKLRKELPRAFQPVVGKALAKRPQDRYVTAKALVKDFNEVVSPSRKPFYKTVAFGMLIGLIAMASVIGLFWPRFISSAYENLVNSVEYQRIVARGDSLLMRKDYQGARESYEKALELLSQERDPFVLTNSMRVLLLQQQLATFLDPSSDNEMYIKQSKKLEVQRDSLLSTMGRAATQLSDDQFRAAASSFMDAYRYVSEDSSAFPRFLEVDSLLDAGQFEAARDTLAQIEAPDPIDSTLLQHIGRAVERLN